MSKLGELEVRDCNANALFELLKLKDKLTLTEDELQRIGLKPLRHRCVKYDKGFFTPCERNILKLLALGLSDSAIAQELRISRGSLPTHISRIVKKLEIDKRFNPRVYIALALNRKGKQ